MTADERRLEALGRLLREGTDATVHPEHDAAERARFLEAVARRPRSARLGAARPWIAGVAFAAIAAIAAFLLWPRAPLGYAAEGALAAPGGYVSPVQDGPGKLRFSDGSVITLAAGSGVRVLEVTPRGARVVIERGAAELDIAPRSGARWSIDAGPYAVQVTGTRFAIAWTPEKNQLELKLFEGGVVVRGPQMEDGVALRAGQVLVADGRGGLRVAEIASAAAAADVAPATADSASAAPAAQPAPDVSGQPASEPATGAATAASPAAPSWSKRVAAGDFQGVLAEAEQLGFDSVLEQGSLDRVVALSDAARYGKRGDVARKALSVLRRRFPTSAQGKSAAFLLGRQADDGGSPGAAIGWYETYLSESPGGTFALEAVGRRMWAVSRARGKGAARPLAEDYLQRHPSGPHAAIARSILEP